MGQSAAARLWGWAVVCLLLLASGPALAGVAVIEEAAADGSGAPNREALESLAILPAESRALLLEAAAEPELLRRAAALQARASERVRLTLAGLEQDQQALAWRLLARPELIEPLRRARSAQEIDRILAGSEDATARAARVLVFQERTVLAELDRLQAYNRGELEGLLMGRPLGVQATFRLLTADAAAMSLLAEEPRLVVSVGALYRRDATATLAALDEIASQALARHADVLPGWEPGAQPAVTSVAQTASAPRREPVEETPVAATASFPVVRTTASTAIIPVSVGPASLPTWGTRSLPRAGVRTATLSGAPHPSRGLSRWSRVQRDTVDPPVKKKTRKLRARSDRRLRDVDSYRFRPRGRLGPDTGRRTGMRALESDSRAFKRSARRRR